MRLLNTIVCLGAILTLHTASSASKEITFVENAQSAASRWVESNPTDLAVVIRLGASTTVEPSTIAYWLRKDFEGEGCKVHFLFERGSSGGSSVGFLTRNHGWGPFSLANSRKNVAEACAQHSFEVERGLH